MSITIKDLERASTLTLRHSQARLEINAMVKERDALEADKAELMTQVAALELRIKGYNADIGGMEIRQLTCIGEIERTFNVKVVTE